MLPGLLLASGVLHAHGGGVDKYGCHYESKTGKYHCHSGPMDGQTFASQSEMLEKLKALQPKCLLEDRLQALKEVKEKGLISDKEYEAQRQRILGEL